MGRHRFGLAMVISLVLVSVAPQANGAAGTPITTCGQTVTTNAFLTQDLICIYSHGVIVGASGITIDLKGFTLRGNRGPNTGGIYDPGFDGVTIKNGVVRNFERGVDADNFSDSVSLLNLAATGNSGFGIYIHGSSPLVKSSTASGNAGQGMYIDSFPGAPKILSSSATGNNVGIVVEGPSIKIQSSTASGNAWVGIVVHGEAAVLKGNRVEGNGFLGGASDLGGLGISVDANVTIPPSGKNIARGNDDPAECDPTYLC